MAELRGVENTDVVNNVSYIFVFLIPLTFFIKNKPLSWTVIIVILAFIISGAKRGAIVCGVVAILIFIYFQYKKIKTEGLQKEERSPQIVNILILLIGISALFYFGYMFIENSELLQIRYESTLNRDSSSRDIIYNAIWDSWFESNNIFRILFGFGYAASLDIAKGAYAHSDWLEILSNFGLVGITIYLLLFYEFFKYIINNKNNIQDRILMLAIGTIVCFTSIFSMWYTNIGGYTLSFVLAYLLANQDETQTNTIDYEDTVHNR
jgi:O-antigen ligase